MFGDKEKCINKFKTWACKRPYESQILGSEFYKKDHTKPLFNKHNIMAIHNLYFWHCSTDVFKILKFRSPISLFTLFDVCRAGILWNDIRQEFSIDEFSTKFSTIKSVTRKLIHKKQKEGNPISGRVQSTILIFLSSTKFNLQMEYNLFSNSKTQHSHTSQWTTFIKYLHLFETKT